jgi:hypothetical protein
MTPAQYPQSDLVFVRSHCHCVRQPLALGQVHPRSVLVAHADQQVIAEISWHEQWRRSVLVSQPGTAWPRTTFGQVALWLRKRTRVALDVELRMLGHVLVLLALPWVLVSYHVWEQCRDARCTPLPAVTVPAPRVLGHYARQESCEETRERLQALWDALEHQGDWEQPPVPDGLRMVTTFVCERAQGE